MKAQPWEAGLAPRAGALPREGFRRAAPFAAWGRAEGGRLREAQA